MNFRDQVVLVTGAGQGIGAAIAMAFAEEASAVIVNDLHTETAAQTANAITSAGGRALAIQANIADRAAVEAMFAAARAHFGAVTTLVNNAGYVPFLPFTDYTPEIWRKTLDIDLGGVFHCTQAAIPQMAERGWGAVVNIASVHASATLPGTAAYAAAKAGVVGFTRNLALELGAKGIRVNCVSPGAIETDALRAYFASLPDEHRERERHHMLDWQPLGRFGSPRDIANIVLFLCSERAAFIHGAEIVADGGVLARLF
jgi:3-oxoacyl-[acyl-carrier protein] reductase